MRVRTATLEDHKDLCALAKQSKYTSSFSSHMFSGGAAYEKGWITVAEDGDEFLGLLCVRHKVRQPETMIYFMIVDKDARGTGAATMLMEELIEETPHERIVLSVMKDNELGLRFWRSWGFEVYAEAYEGKGLKMKLDLSSGESEA